MFFFSYRPFQGGPSVAVPCVSLVSCVAFVVSFFVSYFPFFWYLEKIVLHHYDISWVSSPICVFPNSSVVSVSLLYCINIYLVYFIAKFSSFLHIAYVINM